MSKLPGFKWDKNRKVLHLSGYVKGSGGKVRRERTLKLDSIEQAREEWRKFREEISRVGPAPDTTFQVFVDTELDRICDGVRESTAVWYRGIITSRLLPYFKERKLSAITKTVVEDFVMKCRDDHENPISAARINGILRVLRLLLHAAVDRGYLPIYPLHKLQFEKVDLPELELKRNEQAAFLAAFDDEIAFMADLKARRPEPKILRIDTSPVPSMGCMRKVGNGLRPGSKAAKAYFARFRASREFFVVAIETGLRREDLRLLRWENIDLAKRWIHVVAKKTAKPVAVPITDACRQALLALRARPLVSAFVFITSKGKPFSKSTIDDSFARAKRLAGIARRCRFHDLRHTFGSNAASKGIPLQFIQKAMGHSTLTMVQRYARPDDESVQQAFLSKAEER
jgi:integrase